jgi:uncharacterized membrane protein YdjX (TVP38/TMEM64 family)
MAPIRRRPLYLTLALTAAVAAVVGAIVFHDALIDFLARAYPLLVDREKTQAAIDAAGPWAPLVFMGLQLLQVILAPIPGEATGFIGGYLFGASKGFVYSSISLALGSWINFMIGRFLGRRFVRRIIPDAKLRKMDQTVTHQGALVILLLFIFPGFPKDYLCLFLGLTTMPLQLFLLMAAFGRMPGTLMLSLQGAMLFERMYGIFAFILGICGMGMLAAYRYRDRLYRWIEKMNNDTAPRR